MKLILKISSFLHGDLRFPLEWRMCLGDKGADGNIDITGNAAPLGLVFDLTRQRRYLGNSSAVSPGKPIMK